MDTQGQLDRDAIPTRVAVPLARIANPIGPSKRLEEVLEAHALLQIHEIETLGAVPDPPEGAPLLTALVPADVLQELHVRGEIDLFDEEGRPLNPHAPGLSSANAAASADEDGFEILQELEAEPMPPIGADEVLDVLANAPMFHSLQAEVLQRIAHQAKLRLVADRAYVFREGDPARSFFVVIEGALELVRRTGRKEIALRHVHRGEALGLFGLFAGSKRTACVRSIGPSIVAELSPEIISTLANANPESKSALARFYQERLLESFLTVSPIFADLSAVARGLLIAQFRDRRIAPGEVIVAPGQVFNGLYLVISGEVVITRRVGGGREEGLAALQRGQFFGVVSALSGTPCRVSIASLRDSVIAYLPQRAFNDFVKDYPVLRLLPQRLTQEGLLVEKDVFVGDAGVPGLS